jgi:hypothetical protein
MAKFRFVLCLIVAMLFATGPLPLNAAPTGAVAKPPPKAAAPHAAHTMVTNSHLHGVKAIHPGEIHKVEHHARYWVGRWAYGYWVGLHRGYGAITGNVQSGGRALPGAEVLLVSSRGTPIREKHITHTNISGGYIMMRVRAGSYRVRAVMGERAGHSPVHLYSGTIVSVPVKL